MKQKIKSDQIFTWQLEKQEPLEVVEHILKTGRTLGLETIVCFDYFDTLVTRRVYPERTKKLASSLLSLFLDGELSEKQLYTMRREMEKTLCEQNVSRGDDLDFNLENLALHLYEAIGKKIPGLYKRLSQERFSDILLSLETAVECCVQQPCPSVVETLKAVKKHGLETVLISDFYLPKQYFKKMMMPYGLDKLLDHIYISADHGVTKNSGRLYRRIMDDIGCRPQQMIMIGDDPHADVKIATEAGIKTICVENSKQKDLYRRWQTEYRQQNKKRNAGFALQLKNNTCFPETGITLWIFTYRLFRSLVKNGVRHVFFFSKEGELLKRLFDDFQRTLFGIDIIKTHYLIVSRKATFIASLKPLEKETFSRLLDCYRDISLRDFMLSLNIDKESAEKICSALGLDFETRHKDLPSHPSFKKLLQCNDFKQAYEILRQEQHNGFMAYLDAFGVDYANEGLFVVDVGWKGSTQDNIYHILDGKVAIQGFYVGSLTATQLGDKNRKTGILFSDRPQPSPFFNVYNNNRSLFEVILGASHGSADGYFRPQKPAELPKTKKRQVYARVKSQHDEICAMVLDLSAERRIFEEMIQPLQQNIVETAADCTCKFMFSACRLPEEAWFARRHARMVFRPTGQEVAFFERLYHLENFGIFEYTTFGQDHRTTWQQRWANFKRVLLHPEVLETGIWPPIILRHMNIGMLRYYDGWRRSVGEFGLRWKLPCL